MAVTRKPKADTAKTETEETKKATTSATSYRIELAHVKTYVTPNGDIYHSDRSYPVSAQKRAELFRQHDDKGVPFFRDYDPKRKQAPKKDQPENALADTQAASEDGEIDTGVVKLPKGMRRSERGGVSV